MQIWFACIFHLRIETRAVNDQVYARYAHWCTLWCTLGVSALHLVQASCSFRVSVLSVWPLFPDALSCIRMVQLVQMSFRPCLCLNNGATHFICSKEHVFELPAVYNPPTPRIHNCKFWMSKMPPRVLLFQLLRCSIM